MRNTRIGIGIPVSLLLPLCLSAVGQAQGEPVTTKTKLPMNQFLGGRHVTNEGQNEGNLSGDISFGIPLVANAKNRGPVKAHSFGSLPGPMKGLYSDEAQDNANLAAINQMLSQLEPGQDRINTGDSNIEVRSLLELKAAIIKRKFQGRKTGGYSLDGAGTSSMLSNLWTTNIPYTFNGSMTTAYKFAVARDMRELENHCGINFVPRSSEANWIDYQQITGGASFSEITGKKTTTGSQYIQLHTTYEQVVLHETLHAMGLIHEHKRTDRDSSVTINWGNIMSGYSGQFNIEPSSTLITGYDYLSIMHYSRNNFSTGGDTITALNGTYQNYMGSGSLTHPAGLLSEQDQDTIAILYGWPSIAALWTQSTLSHQTGQADGSGWSAVVGRDTANSYMTYGPYTKNVGLRNQTAFFELSVDSISGPNALVGRIEVYNASDNVIVNQLPIYKSYFPAANVYTPFMRYFYVDPTTDQDDLFEFRVYWYGNANLKARNVGVSRVEYQAFNETSHLPNTGAYGTEVMVGAYDTPVDNPLNGSIVWKSDQLSGHTAGYMAYGPYTTTISDGSHKAYFVMNLTDAATNYPNAIVRLDAYDATTNTVLASRDVYASEVERNNTVSRYELPFTLDVSRLGHQMEFRVYWYGSITTTFYSSGVL